jgi:hypothetical protein
MYITIFRNIAWIHCFGRPINWFTEFATNATARNVGVVLYSGNNDALIAHRGTESLYLYFLSVLFEDVDVEVSSCHSST